MACIENIPPVNADSEMEEGEIVDELDDLSDISSEEEFLLRQRLQVLENYNNVLERKKAKNSCFKTGKPRKCIDLLPQDLSEISATDNEETFPQITIHRNNNNARHIKHKKRKATTLVEKNRDTKKKSHRIKKKLVPKVVLQESSDESDDEYRNKRRKLANAVVVNTPKPDTSTLRARLRKMFGTQSQEPIEDIVQKNSSVKINANLPNDLKTRTENFEKEMDTMDIEKPLPQETLNGRTDVTEFIDLCNDDSVITANDDIMPTQDTVDGVVVNNEKILAEPVKSNSGDSDEDLELLRQHALKTKVNKTKTEELQIGEKVETENKPQILSEDEDSDTAELRLICLKSAFLKKAIEMKQKQKMRKRLSQSINEEFDMEDEIINRKIEAENNTDIESVDMDIGSDGDEKFKEISDPCNENIKHVAEINTELNILKDAPLPSSPQKEEMDEDEDLLRAKLLTSLSKNWPHLVDPTTVIENASDVPSPDVPPSTAKSKTSQIVEKPFIIKLGESDSEGEHEATKNLTKMHIKLSEQIDFQQKLDMFLKSTRMEVEKQTLPDVVQQSPEPAAKAAPKYVAKTVKHLPKSEQIEYKNLVKRMAELEKIKQARQASMNLSKAAAPAKETLKPRNTSNESAKTINNLEEKIAVSRKKIAEESAKMLKLKEESTNLTQKYKIVATELKNIATAITFNKKEQRSVQSRLNKIRLQHQTLIKSSTLNKHSKTNFPVVIRNNVKNVSSNKLQKENDPSKENDPLKEEYKNLQLLKSVKVSVVNDLNDESVVNSRLSVQVDVSSNKKTVKGPKIPNQERIVGFTSSNNEPEDPSKAKNPIVENGGGERSEGGDNKSDTSCNLEENVTKPNDYISPLEALQSGNWAEDPNSFLCPFEVGGSCKDPDCKYLHPKIPSDQ